MDPKQEIVDKNYAAFRKALPGIMQQQAGRFALMRHAEIVDFFDTAADAVTTGKHLYKDGEFSIQKVTQTPINLGRFSYAGYWGVR